MSTIKDARPVFVNSFLANGGIVYTGEGNRSFFDEDTNRFVLLKGMNKFTFQTLEELACAVAFLNADVAINRRAASRYEWFVLTFDEIFAVFPRKKDAILYCMRVNEDMRSVRNIVKIDEGMYEYSGPKKIKSYHFYVGLRKAVQINGFGTLLEIWDEKINQLERERKAIEKIRLVQIRMEHEQKRRERYEVH